jgi:putative salt-induced outer membrane protein YdiY
MRSSGTLFITALFFILTLGLSPGLSQDNTSAVQDKDKEEQKNVLKYNSQTSLSLVLTRGNNKNFSFSFDTNQTLKIHKANTLELKGRFINTESNGEKKSEVYYSHLKYDRKIGKKAYLLSFFRYERNRLAGYNYRLALSVGGGATWIDNEKFKFASEMAFGWNNEKNTQRLSIGNVNGSSVWENTIKASFLSSIITNNVNFQLSENAQFSLQEVLFLNLEEIKDFRLNSYLSLTASINSNLALKTSIQVVYENLPVEGYKNTDTYFLSSIVFKI